MSKKYSIGQILYIANHHEQTVIPVQVQEINQKTTINGDEIIYIAKDAESGKFINLDQVSGEIFKSPEELIKSLKENASKAIESMVGKIVKMSNVTFGIENNSEELSKNDKPPTVIYNKETNSSIVEEVVETVNTDGTISKIKQKTRISLGSNGVDKMSASNYMSETAYTQ
jgi:hypothetical protein